MHGRTYGDLTTLCKEYSYAASTYCLVRSLAIAISVLNPMPGNHAGSFSTGSKLKPGRLRQAYNLLTYREGGNDDRDVGTHDGYRNFLHLCRTLDEFVIVGRGIVIIRAVQNDGGSVSQRNITWCSPRRSTKNTYSNTCLSNCNGVPNNCRRSWHALRC